MARNERRHSVTQQGDASVVAPSWRQRFFGIPEREVSFTTRGYEPCDSSAREFLERIVREFVGGYHLALDIADTDRLVNALDTSFDDHHVGFAYEGTGMYFALRDLVWPWGQSRLRAFIEGAAKKHDFIVMVGAGFAIGRVPWGLLVFERYMRRLDPKMVWCVPDGYGFYKGIFEHRRYIEACAPPPSRLPRYAWQLFDSGIGRSLWWVKGASPERIKQAIERFPAHRQAEMWCGIGVACTYAGGIDEDGLQRLLEYAGSYRLDFLSGPPFAARMREEGGNRSPWTDRACACLLGKNAKATAALTLDVQGGLPEKSMTAREICEQTYPLVRAGLRDVIERERVLSTPPRRSAGPS